MKYIIQHIVGKYMT